MKFLLVPILMLLVLSQTFSKWMIVASYKLNQDYVASTLCVNKAKPKLNCKGKCQLKKELSQQEDRNNTQSGNMIKIGFQEILFSMEAMNLEPPVFSFINTKYNTENTSFTPTAHSKGVFHPPACIILA